MIFKTWIIYSINPSEDGNEIKTVIELFDTKQDAELVLEVLEKVNISFNTYKIEYVEKEY